MLEARYTETIGRGQLSVETENQRSHCGCVFRHYTTIRFRKLISKAALMKLYKAFILPHFYYCSSVWHFCGARNTEKIEVLNKRIVRFILGDFESVY